MLTKSDLQHIGQILEEKLEEKLEDKLAPLKKDIKTLTKDMSQTRTDVKVLISYFDREYIELRKRIDRIEEHLGLPSKN